MFTTAPDIHVRSIKCKGKQNVAATKSKLNAAPVIDISAHSRLLAVLEQYPEAKRDVLKALSQR